MRRHWLSVLALGLLIFASMLPKPVRLNHVEKCISCSAMSTSQASSTGRGPCESAVHQRPTAPRERATADAREGRTAAASPRQAEAAEHQKEHKIIYTSKTQPKIASETNRINTLSTPHTKEAESNRKQDLKDNKHQSISTFESSGGEATRDGASIEPSSTADAVEQRTAAPNFHTLVSNPGALRPLAPLDSDSSPSSPPTSDRCYSCRSVGNRDNPGGINTGLRSCSYCHATMCYKRDCAHQLDSTVCREHCPCFSCHKPAFRECIPCRVYVCPECVERPADVEGVRLQISQGSLTSANLCVECQQTLGSL